MNQQTPPTIDEPQVRGAAEEKAFDEAIKASTVARDAWTGLRERRDADARYLANILLDGRTPNEHEIRMYRETVEALDAAWVICSDASAMVQQRHQELRAAKGWDQ